MIALFDVVTAAAAKKTSANPLSLVFIVVIVGAVYFLFLRPQQQRARRQLRDVVRQLALEKFLNVGTAESQRTEVVEKTDGAELVHRMSRILPRSCGGR